MKVLKTQRIFVSLIVIFAMAALPFVLAGCGSSDSGTAVPSMDSATVSDSGSTGGNGAGAGNEVSGNTSMTSSTSGVCDAARGAELYESKGCAGCHGSLAASDKKGATVAEIKNGIQNIGMMSQYSTLTDDEIYDIAFALEDVNGCERPAAGGGDTGAACDASKGGELYESTGCASCHGSLATSVKTGATFAEIKDGIQNVGAMSQYATLTDDEIYDIAFALGDVNGCEKSAGSADNGTDSGSNDGSDNEPAGSGAGSGSGAGTGSGLPVGGDLLDVGGLLGGNGGLPIVGDLLGGGAGLPIIGSLFDLGGVLGGTGGLPVVGVLGGGGLPIIGSLFDLGGILGGTGGLPVIGGIVGGSGGLPIIGGLLGGGLPLVGAVPVLGGGLPVVGDLTGASGTGSSGALNLGAGL